MIVWYPKVLGEWETLQQVLAGHSIARYGDGELKLMYGRRCVSQVVVPGIEDELQKVVLGGNGCLIGIPTIDTRSPKYELWAGMRKKFSPLLSRKLGYVSSFITRPDSAPWLGAPEYFDAIESLWKGQRVTFIGNGVRSLTPKFLMDTGAAHVDWVECSYAHSYVEIDRLQRAALAHKNHRVLLCVGPTATCLAYRLCEKGRQAIDLGHIGMFWRRYDEFAKWVEQREINKETGLVEPNP